MGGPDAVFAGNSQFENGRNGRRVTEFQPCAVWRYIADQTFECAIAAIEGKRGALEGALALGGPAFVIPLACAPIGRFHCKLLRQPDAELQGARNKPGPASRNGTQARPRISSETRGLLTLS